MLSKELEYLCTQLECFLQGWNAFDSVDIPLYRVAMLSTGWECFLKGWNAFDSVGIPLYRVGMLSTG
jgi:type IV secretory pathway protease TraF